ncbi:MAG: DUF3800 domain-containing protein, partial [Cyanobacteria bacterium J06634_6]
NLNHRNPHNRWFQQPNFSTETSDCPVRKWREENRINFEFHFSKLSKNKVFQYESFLHEVVGFFDALSFKASLVRTKGLSRSMDETVSELYQRCIGNCIDYEISRKRASLPRRVSIYKDKEGDSDVFLLGKIEERLNIFYVAKYQNKLSMGSIEAVDSKRNYFIQLADLYIGSITRIVNRREGDSRNHKDDFADFVVGLLGLDMQKLESPNQDSVYVDIIE